MIQTLLALLLALRRLQSALSAAEKSALGAIAQQLALQPDWWDDIEPDLLALVNANPALQQEFQTAKIQLASFEEIPPTWLPTWTELNQELPVEQTGPVSFGYEEDLAASELLTATTRIFSAPEPTAAAQCLSALQRAEAIADLTETGDLKLYSDRITIDEDEVDFDEFNNLDALIRDSEAEYVSRSGLSVTESSVTAKSPLPIPMQPEFEPESEQRYFNTFFAKTQSSQPITEEPLICSQVYCLGVDISPERKGADETDITFPDRTLRQIWQEQEFLPIDVVASSRDFDIDPTVKTLNLPRSGASKPVYFAVLPRQLSGRGRLQVELFYRGYLLQVKQVEAAIAPSADTVLPPSLKPFHSARVIFTTTESLTPAQLAQLPERVLTIDVERDERDGSIDFRFLDRTKANQELAFYDTIAQPDSLKAAIAAVRQQLYDTLKQGYYGEVEGSLAQLNQWLPALADAGHELYRELLPKDTLNEQQTECLNASLKPDTVIQVNPIVGRVTLPWAVLYERKVNFNKRTQVCDRFPEHDLDCTGCPSRSDPNHVCPYAFWGFRYAIEQLPCWSSQTLPTPKALMRQIKNTQPLRLNFNVWRDFEHWHDHLPKLKAAAVLEVLLAEELPELEAIWNQQGTDLDVVYFYCHGGIEDRRQRPYLELSDDRIYSNSLECFEEKPWTHAPLVFLNGCATGSYGPESYVSLIDDFLKLGASGVVGTECTVTEAIAESYAAALFPRLFQGEPLGQAMLKVRREMLARFWNPLGLAYSLYAAHEIALAHAVYPLSS